MRHTFECPLRWADMDLLGHVNNVTYLDYLAEARRAFFGGEPAAAAPVTRHQVEFRAPLVFHRRPVLVDSWVTEVSAHQITLGHEVYDAAAAERGTERTSYLRALSTLAHTPTAAESDLLDAHRGDPGEWRSVPSSPHNGRGVSHPLHVRGSDIDERGLARDDAYFEFFQEARIQFLMSLHTRGQQWTQHVVARTDVDYLAPVTLRPEPYTVCSWVGHLGTRSFTVQAELRDADRLLARAEVVMVTFDNQTQRPAPMAEAQRLRLAAALEP